MGWRGFFTIISFSVFFLLHLFSFSCLFPLPFTSSILHLGPSFSLYRDWIYRRNIWVLLDTQIFFEIGGKIQKPGKQCWISNSLCWQSALKMMFKKFAYTLTKQTIIRFNFFIFIYFQSSHTHFSQDCSCGAWGGVLARMLEQVDWVYFWLSPCHSAA